MRAGFAWYLFAAALAVLLWWMLASPDEDGRQADQQAAVTQPIAPAPAELQPAQRPAAPPPPPQAALPAEGGASRNLLANERAEVERHAALREKREEAPPKTKLKRETKLFYKVMVRDGGTLEAGGTVITLHGIAARGTEDSCKDASGKTWQCGAASRAALARLIRGRAVSCTLPPGGGTKAFAATCSVGDTDLAEWMVAQGWAEPTEPVGLAMRGAANAAREQRIGIWRTAE